MMIKLTNTLILDLLEKNLQFKRENHSVIGDCIAVTDYEAYIFSLIASASYLNKNEDAKLSRFPRERYIVYNQAEEYKFQNGLFDRSNLFSLFNANTDYRNYSFIGNKDQKYIFIIEYSGLQELKTKIDLTIKDLNKQGYDEKSFLAMFKHNSQNNPPNFESFFEYIVSRKFNNMGFITDTQVPFYYGSGTPDMVSYNILDLNEVYRGFSVIELMALRVFKKDIFRGNNFLGKQNNDKIAVYEAKVNQSQAKNQIKKYLKLNLFNEAYEIIPVKKTVSGEIGLVTFTEDGILEIIKSSKKLNFDRYKQKKYLSWFIDYLKCYLLANLNEEELEKTLNESNYHFNIEGLNSFVKNCNIKDIVDLVLQSISVL